MENNEHEFPKDLQDKADEVLDSVAKAKQELGESSKLDFDYIELVVKREISNYKDGVALIKKIAANSEKGAAAEKNLEMKARMETMSPRINALIGMLHDGFIQKMEYLKGEYDKFHS